MLLFTVYYSSFSDLIFGGNDMLENEMPLGFVMSLAQNSEALEKFNSLSEIEKQEILNKTHSIRSKSEMRKFVSSLVTEQEKNISYNYK